MWWAKILATLTGQTVENVIAYKTAKQTLKANIVLERLKGKAEYERAKSERASESEGFDAQWEAQSINNSGWKDEGTWLVLSIPLILVFFPIFQPAVLAGFAALETTPLWYRVLISTVYLATFGIRMWRRNLNKATDVVGMLK